MANDDWVEGFISGVACLILGKLLVDVLRKYRCPRCNYPVGRINICCPNCGQPLDWRGK